MPDATRAALEAVYRAESGAILATLIRVLGDFDDAEECLQEAVAAALERWPLDGVPSNPAAWLVTAARRRALDRLRHGRVRDAGLARVARETHPGQGAEPVFDFDDPWEDDRLRLIFTCCSPALALESQVALTLRTLCGLDTAQIARAFLLSEAALAQRIVRAKRKIRAAGIPYRVPPAELRAERLPGVLGVVYLVFNEGYSGAVGADLARRELCGEAVRLGRLLAATLGDEPEVLGLLALMLLHDARREARADAHGELVLLEDQDRGRWDRARIDEGAALLERALAARRAGPYQIQAAIAALHAAAPTAGATDWAEIAALYGVLGRMTGSEVVELNRAVAVAMAEGPERGLALVEALVHAGRLDAYPFLHSTRADFLRRLGRRAEARAAYLRALDLAHNAAERAFLSRRAAQMDDG